MTGAAVRLGTVEAAGVALSYAEQGDGVPLLLVHGTAVARELWREVLGELADDFRAIAYDRRAYGDSGAPDPYRGTTVSEQGEDAAALAGRLGAAPALVCGFEVGALAALDLAWRHRELVRGLVLVEPPVLAFSIEGPAVMSSLREAIEEGARQADDPSAGAADGYLREVAGEEASELLGAERLAGARASGRALAADLVGAPTYAFGRRELVGIDVPAVVLRGTRSTRVRREVAARLASLLPRAELRDADAGHLVPVEAPEATAEAIREVATG